MIRLLALSVLLAGSFALGACGYSPLYARSATSPAAQSQLALIEVGQIPDRVGQMMRRDLTRQLSPQARNLPSLYDLKVTLTESLSTLAVEKNAFATRANLTLNANYELIRKADRQVLAAGSAKAVSSYNILTSNFATLAAKDDSRARAVQGVAETIRTRLAVYFQGPGLQQPSLATTGGRL